MKHPRSFKSDRTRGLRNLRRVGLATAAAAGLLASAMSAANANLIVDISIDGGALINLVNDSNDAGPDSFNYSNAIFSIVGGGALSNSPGTASLAEVLSSTLSVKNVSTGLHTLRVLIGAQNFTSPTTPPDLLLDSHIGGSTSVNDGANLASFASCVRQSNVAAGSACGGATYVTPTGHPNITAGSWHDDQFLTIPAAQGLAAPYSINQDLLLTLSAGSQINYGTNTTLSPVPEPGAVTLLAVGLIGLGVASRRRRTG